MKMFNRNIADFSEPEIMATFNPEIAGAIAPVLYDLQYSGRERSMDADGDNIIRVGSEEIEVTRDMLRDVGFSKLSEAIQLEFIIDPEEAGLKTVESGSFIFRPRLQQAALSAADKSQPPELKKYKGELFKHFARKKRDFHWHIDDKPKQSDRGTRIAFGSTGNQIEILVGKVPLARGSKKSGIGMTELDVNLEGFPSEDIAIERALENGDAFIFPMIAGQIALMTDRKKPNPHRASHDEWPDDFRFSMRASIDDGQTIYS